MTAPATVLNSLLPLESVQLGRLVVNYMNPHQTFHDPVLYPSLPPGCQVLTKPQSDIQEVLSSAKNVIFLSRLTALFSTSYQVQDTNAIKFTAGQATTYHLSNSDTWISKACEDSDTRAWLEKRLQYSADIYLVVGFQTFTNALVTGRTTYGKGIGSGVHLSGSLLSGGTAPQVVGNALASRVSTMREVQTDAQSTFVATGEQIYAVQYRKLKFDWFSSRKIDKSFLEQRNRWRIVSAELRTDDSDDEEDEDVLEVDLTDELGLKYNEIYVSEDGTVELGF